MSKKTVTHINLVGGSSAPSKPKKRKKRISGGRGVKSSGRAVALKTRGTSRNPR
tara:strand:+ start:2359 stop:2520 length:162 start_codon:yes stop_codon:yes gene_type:complete